MQSINAVIDQPCELTAAEVEHVSGGMLQVAMAAGFAAGFVVGAAIGIGVAVALN
jgi:lactobin A/cerein 7B family class IIb bacteriocin